MSAKKGLGRTFESLIPSELLDESFDPTAQDDGRVSDLRTIKLTDITPDPDQPRRDFNSASLKELTASIREHGVLQPIVVVPHKGKYMIVAGERRYRASNEAGKTSIPALVRTLSDQHKLELSLIENIQRRDLNALETATAYAKLRDQFNLSLEEIGVRVGGKSMSAISNTLRLLRLPELVKQALVANEITEGQARPLVGTKDSVIADILPKIIKEQWSARTIEAFVAEAKPSTKTSGRAKPVPSKKYTQLQEQLGTKLATKVKVAGTQRGRGKITIEFASEEELERIKSLLS